MKSNIISRVLVGLLGVAAAIPAAAQVQVPATKLGALIYGSGTINLTDNEATELVVPAYSRYKFVVTEDTWVQPTVRNGEIRLSVDKNNSATTRTATLTVKTSAGSETTTIQIKQPGWNFIDDAKVSYTSRFATPVRCVDAAKESMGRANSGSESLENTYDGDANTIYHTNYSGFSSYRSNEWPVLEYYFTEAGDVEGGVDLESVTYVPRQDEDGSRNGNFGVITVEVAHKNGTALKWTSVTPEPLDLKMASSSTVISFPDELQDKILGVRFTVQSGYCNKENLNFASCAEMQFNKKGYVDGGHEVFADEICSALKPGVTQKDIDAMTDPFYKKLAQVIFDGEYDPAKMVSTHNAVMSPETLAELWNAPGKCYDRSQGVTGVAVNPGKYVVMVSGIPQEKGSIGMVVIRWHGHEIYTDDKGDEQKWYAERFNYNLVNGINIINVPAVKRPAEKMVKGHDMGLVYINNFDDVVTTPEIGAERAVKVHIVGALHNGYISNLKTNAENQKILDQAIYPVIDCLGTRVHSAWQVQALKSHAKGQYVRYINLLDQIIVWEHRVLGLDKYNRVPENRTMTFVNYNYYMYQGGWGPTFMYDTQWRVCNPDRLMTGDSDAIWGLSHEWGHQHQMAPYFRWIGTAEVTNNIFSAYNVIHMGYNVRTNRERYHYSNWHDFNGQTAKIRRLFLNDDYNRTITPPDEKGETKTANDGDNIVMSLRTDAAKAAKAGRAFWWCDELKQFAINQVKYPTKRFATDKTYTGAPADTWNPANTEDPRNIVDPRRALNPIEAYSSNNGELILGPFLYLMYYFSEENPERAAEDYRPDLWPDLFESMRQNDQPEGSTVEPGKTTADKYEILTSAFNSNRSTDPSINKVAQFKERFPESCWTTRGYIGGENDRLSWTTNSAPAILNCIYKLSRLTGYNLWSYFDAFGLFTVAAIEQGDYGTQYYIMTDAMYDEFKADMFQLEKDGTVKPLPEDIRLKISNSEAPVYPAPVIPNDRPITSQDN